MNRTAFLLTLLLSAQFSSAAVRVRTAPVAPVSGLASTVGAASQAQLTPLIPVTPTFSASLTKPTPQIMEAIGAASVASFRAAQAAAAAHVAGPAAVMQAAAQSAFTLPSGAVGVKTPALEKTADAAPESFARAGFSAAAKMSETLREVNAGRSDAASSLRASFDNGVSASGSALPTAGSAAFELQRHRSGLMAGQLSAKEDLRAEPDFNAPRQAPKMTAWQKIWAVTKLVASAGAGLYIGNKVGDLAYSIDGITGFSLRTMGLTGLIAASLSAALLGYFLRRRSAADKPQTLWAFSLAAFMFNVGGQLLDDVSGIGLWAFAVSIPVAIGLLLYSMGLGSRK